MIETRIYVNYVTPNHAVDYIFICESETRYIETYFVLKANITY